MGKAWIKRTLFNRSVVLISLGSSMADTFRNRQLNQERRIQQGIRSGELTPRESRKLQKEVNRICRERRWASKDGVITPRERNRIDRHLDHASRDIYRQSTTSWYNRIQYPRGLSSLAQ